MKELTALKEDDLKEILIDFFMEGFLLAATKNNRMPSEVFARLYKNHKLLKLHRFKK